ncbi:hypothetical protein JHK87_051712 [Glycine soja]|nr:hypothetical protein JHK87_051712 [Glycine soja]
MFRREEQMSGQSAKRIPLRDAVSKNVSCLCIDKYRLRFRQHLANEMVTMLLTVGMQRLSAPLVGLSVLALLTDLHTICVLTRIKVVFYKWLVKNFQNLRKWRSFGNEGEVEFQVCTLGKVVTIKKNMVTIQKKKNIEHERVFTRSVIDSSFGIGRIIYCLFEHTFYTRQSKAGDQQLNVFRFSSLVAPIKCTVFPLVQNQKYEEVAKLISKSLTAAGISHKIDTSTMWIKYKFSLICTSIGKRYARTDELDVPFAITVDSTSSVTIRERDSKGQVRVDVDKAASVVREVTEGQRTWEDVWSTSPHHSSTSASADD